MLRFVCAAIIAAFVIPAASADQPYPTSDQIAHMAAACTSKGAFGYRFGDKTGPHHMEGTHFGSAKADSKWAPVGLLMLTETGDPGRIWEIDGLVSLEYSRSDDPLVPFAGPGNDHFALAAQLVKALDAEVARSGRFVRREEKPKEDPDDDDITFYSAPGKDAFQLSVWRQGLGVHVSCTSEAMQEVAKQADEFRRKLLSEHPN